MPPAKPHYRSSPRWQRLVIMAITVGIVWYFGDYFNRADPTVGPSQQRDAVSTDHSSDNSEASSQSAGEQQILAAYRDQRRDVIVQAEAVVEKILPDDNIGSRHQKMILRLTSGHTVLLAHNIDLAPRVPVSEGDTIEFKGEYEYTDQGGVVHWTHHDPDGRHVGGWLKVAGKKYE